MPNLLFLTPVLPYPTGHGSAMRASIALEILAEKYNVTVVHPNLWGWRDIFDEDWVRLHAEHYELLPPQPSPGDIQRLAAGLGNKGVDAVYIFRLAAASVALQILNRLRPGLPVVLDLDDDEFARAERFSALPGQPAADSQEIQRLAIFYKMMLPRFGTKLLAQSADCERMARTFAPQKFLHLPNVVRPAEPVVRAPEDHMLYLGTMDYAPNEDAVAWFCESILPLLQADGGDWKLRVAGGGASARIRGFGQPGSGVEIAGAVPEVAPEYARAAFLIVPLRAGGGTRIKILEAFSYKVPVVSTTLGAEGLGVVAEEHLLLADTPEQFASACRRLSQDAELRDRLTRNAFDWLAQTHSINRVREVLHQLYGSTMLS